MSRPMTTGPPGSRVPASAERSRGEPLVKEGDAQDGGEQRLGETQRPCRRGAGVAQSVDGRSGGSLVPCLGQENDGATVTTKENLMSSYTRDELIARLIRAGELEVSGDHPEEVQGYFDTERFRFHGPDGFESDYAGLDEYFASLRHAFDDRTIRRGVLLAEGVLVACQTWIEGTFTRPFTHSPVGRVEPNGARVVMDLINIFRFDDQGRLIEEFVRTDNRSLLRQLGADAA